MTNSTRKTTKRRHITTPALGIIAGSGSLPARLATTAKADGRDVFIVKLIGQADDSALDSFPHTEVRLGAAGKMLSELRAHYVRDVVMAGGVRRPSLLEMRPDWRGALFLAKLGAKSIGDDTMLSAISEAFREEGFRVIGAHELATDILTPEGLIGHKAPDDEMQEDIHRGIRVAKAIGALDVGQAVVIQEGLILGVEAIEGTDALIKRAGALQRKGRGGILVKVKKPQQDEQVDLPTMGVETVHRAAKAGLSGIIMEAGGTLMLDQEAVAIAADRCGIFVLGLRIEEYISNLPNWRDKCDETAEKEKTPPLDDKELESETIAESHAESLTESTDDS